MNLPAKRRASHASFHLWRPNRTYGGAILALLAVGSCGPARVELGSDAHVHVMRANNWSLLPATIAEWEVLANKLCPRGGGGKKQTPSSCIHLLRLWGPHAAIESGSPGQALEIVGLLTDNSKAANVFGENLIVNDTQGIWYRVRQPLFAHASRAEEHHTDQVLAALAEMGVPASHSVRAGCNGPPLSLADAIRGAVRHFDIRQNDIEWTAVALAAYWPPRNSWVNRFNQEFSFDDIAQALLTRVESGRASCGATHLLYAIIALARVDLESPVFCPSMRARVLERLRGLVARVVATQRTDGSWDSSWRESRVDSSPPAASDDALIVTGHMVELLCYLPRDLCPQRQLVKGGEWLWRRLQSEAENCRDPLASIGICPLTHALCATRLLCRDYTAVPVDR